MRFESLFVRRAVNALIRYDDFTVRAAGGECSGAGMRDFCGSVVASAMRRREPRHPSPWIDVMYKTDVCLSCGFLSAEGDRAYRREKAGHGYEPPLGKGGDILCTLQAAPLNQAYRASQKLLVGDLQRFGEHSVRIDLARSVADVICIYNVIRMRKIT